ncbi:MAG: hypothetical protein H6R03_1391 [Burkholderiaceae bacterium]|nr:hypothetical protein [Burkholderiaceae bacterium]
MRRTSLSATQTIAPQRPAPAVSASTATMLIPASASTLTFSASAPGRSSPWIRNPDFFSLKARPAFLAAVAKRRVSSGTTSICARRPRAVPLQASRFTPPLTIEASTLKASPGRSATEVEK